MLLNRLTAGNLHEGTASNLHRLTARKDLPGYLISFLITCETEGLSPYSIKYYNYQLDRFVQFCGSLGITEPKQITRDEIRLFILDLKEHRRRPSLTEKGNKPTSVLTYFKAVRRFINWLQEEKVFTEENNPIRGMKPPKVPEYIIRPPSASDIQSLLILTSGDKFIPVRNRAMLLTFMDTAVRLIELYPMQLDDVDPHQGIIKVMGKGQKERLVRAGKHTISAIVKYTRMRRDNYPDLWVSEEGRPLSRDGVRQIIAGLFDRAEIIDVKHGPHALRHYGATNCLKNGMDSKYVQILLGHRDPRMTQRYTKTINDEDAIKAHIKASPVDNLLK